MSKGSRPRPYSVSQEEFANNYDRIFGRSKLQKEIDSLQTMKDSRTEGEKQSEAFLKNEYYDKE